jgi:hypothetical protein
MSQLSFRILSSSSLLRIMMSSSSSLLTLFGVFVVCVSSTSDSSESESDPVLDDDWLELDSELSSSSSDSDSSSSSLDFSFVVLSGFCGAVHSLFLVATVIWSMLSKCRFSASVSSVSFSICSNNSCGISVSRKDVKFDVVNYAVDVAMNCSIEAPPYIHYLVL